MIRKEIIEGNKLIAEFDGYRKDPYYGWLASNKTDHWDDKYRSDDYLQYHSSWDWLMPLVGKIENMSHKGFPINVTIGSSGAYIGINPTNSGGEKYDGEKVIANTLNINYFANLPQEEICKIESVWKACIQFIKWHNNEQKKK